MRIGFVYFLTAAVLGLVVLLVVHSIPTDSRALIEGVLSALIALLGSAVHAVFRAEDPAVTSASPRPPRDAASSGPDSFPTRPASPAET